MAVLISDSRNPNYNGKLSTPNSWYTCFSAQLNGSYSTGQRFDTSEQFITASVPFNGNAIGLCYGLMYVSSAYIPSGSYLRKISSFFWQIYGTCTLTGGNPGIITFANHGLSVGTEIRIDTTGTLPSPLSKTVHYFVSNVIDSDNFNISSTPGGSSINWTGGGSGTHVLHVVLNRTDKSLEEISDNIPYFHGAYFVPCKFSNAIPVSASKTYLISLIHSGSQGTVNQYIRWMCVGNNTTSYMYALWSDATASAVSDQDQLIIMDPVEIDRPFTFKGLAHPDTTIRVCGVTCPYAGGINSPITASLYMNTSPTSSLELVFDGAFAISAHGNVRFGYPENRISNVILRYRYTSSLGGAVRTGFCDLQCGNSYYGVRSGLLIYGTIPNNYRTRLLSNLPAGSKTASIEATNGFFNINDRFHMFAGGDSDSYLGRWQASEIPNVTNVIETPTGSVVYFNTATPSFTRVSGSGVYNLTTKWGVEIRSDRTNLNAECRIISPAAFVLSGVKMVNIRMDLGYASSGIITIYDNIHCTTQSIQDVAIYDTFGGQTGITWFGSTAPTVFERYYLGYCNSTPTSYALSYKQTFGTSVQKISTGPVIFSQSFFEGIASSAINPPNFSYLNISLDNCYFDNVNVAIPVYGKVIGKNITIYRSGYGIAYGLAFNSLLENVKINRTGNAIHQHVGISNKNNIIRNLEIGLEYPNTNIFSFGSDTLFDLTIMDYTGSLNFTNASYSDITLNLYGCLYKFVQSSGYQKTQQLYGHIERCGPDLPDTTTHTSGSGKYSMKMVPTTNDTKHSWKFDIPTGDISGKDMVIGLWCKISSSAYYSGNDFNLPTLNVYYDNDQSISSVSAVASTDWQYIMTSFRPQTPTGKISVELAIKSDAYLDGAVYFDDLSILYPAGYSLNLGGLDMWSDGYPVTPPISTNISAIDVWSIDPNIFGNGSIGDHVYRKILTVPEYLLLK